MDKQDLIVFARQAGIRDCTCNGGFGCLEMFAALVAAAEREACAKVCETEWSTFPEQRHGYDLASAIRARGQE